MTPSGNFQGAIELAVTGLPAGVTVSPDKIDADQDEVELSFKVADEAKPFKGKKSIKVQATGAIGDQKVKFETAAIPLSFKTSR